MKTTIADLRLASRNGRLYYMNKDLGFGMKVRSIRKTSHGIRIMAGIETRARIIKDVKEFYIA